MLSDSVKEIALDEFRIQKLSKHTHTLTFKICLCLGVFFEKKCTTEIGQVQTKKHNKSDLINFGNTCPF